MSRRPVWVHQERFKPQLLEKLRGKVKGKGVPESSELRKREKRERKKPKLYYCPNLLLFTKK
jgi:hypothetical protein